MDSWVVFVSSSNNFNVDVDSEVPLDSRLEVEFDDILSFPEGKFGTRLLLRVPVLRQKYTQTLKTHWNKRMHSDTCFPVQIASTPVEAVLRKRGSSLRTLSCFCFALFFFLTLPKVVKAHTNSQPRVFHLIVHKKGVELYVNFLLPRTSMSRFWLRLFDRNRNKRLEPRERLALGRFLVRRGTLLKGGRFFWNEQAFSWRFREIQNSRLRGNPRGQSYAWDVRFTARLPQWTQGTHQLSLTLPLMTPKEKLPLAGVVVGPEFRFLRTRSTALIRKKTRALCTLQKRQKSCVFLLRYAGSKASTLPVTRPANKR
jgi:hypothetical protein